MVRKYSWNALLQGQFSFPYARPPYPAVPMKSETIYHTQETGWSHCMHPFAYLKQKLNNPWLQLCLFSWYSSNQGYSTNSTGDFVSCSSPLVSTKEDISKLLFLSELMTNKNKKVSNKIQSYKWSHMRSRQTFSEFTAINFQWNFDM